MSTYKHITSAAKVHSDIEHSDTVPLLKNPYKALDNAYRCLIDHNGLDFGSVENSNLLTGKVDFGNGVVTPCQFDSDLRHHGLITN